MASHNLMPIARDRHALAKLIWSKVAKGRDCWLWTGYKNTRGYGCINLNTIKYRATRIVWWLETGQDPGALCVLHRCDNPPCCRPDHLFLGTKADNGADMAAKGRVNIADAVAAAAVLKRTRTHCKNGHEFTPENTGSRECGRRRCRTCHREGNRMYEIKRNHRSSPN